MDDAARGFQLNSSKISRLQQRHAYTPIYPRVHARRPQESTLPESWTRPNALPTSNPTIVVDLPFCVQTLQNAGVLPGDDGQAGQGAHMEPISSASRRFVGHFRVSSTGDY